MTQFAEQISGHFNELKTQIPPKLDKLTAYLSDLKQNLPNDIETYMDQLKSVNKDELIEDFRSLKLTPVTITISVLSITTVLVVGKLIFANGESSDSGNKIGSKSDKSKKGGKRKKVSKAQKTNKAIQDILDNFENNWVPQINEYFDSYKSLKPEDVEYKFTYFQEMLLKELFALDGIDTLGNDIIRENRKKVIQFIQDHQKRLDSFKKEIDL